MKETLEFNHKKQCGLWLILIGIVLIIAVICGGKFFVNPLGFLSRGTFQGMGKIRREKPRGRLKAVFGGG